MTRSACISSLFAASLLIGCLAPPGAHAAPPEPSEADTALVGPPISAAATPLAGAALPASEKRPLFGGPPDRTVPSTSRAPSESIGVMSMLLPLALVVGLAVLCAGVIRKALQSSGTLAASLGAGGKAPPGILEVLGRYPVSRGSTLVLLRMDRRVLLISQSQGWRGGGAVMSTLAEVGDPTEVASILGKVQEAQEGSVAQRFRSLLAQVERGEAPPDEPEPFRAPIVSPEGDRSELWDARAAAEERGRPTPALGTPVRPSRTSSATEARGVDPVRSLRERIEAMKIRSSQGAGT